VVLGCGVDRTYPTTNAALFEQIARTGLLVSEWPPGTEPDKHRFVIRNRTIAALTQATVATESATNSGTIQMMDRAFTLGRHGMVVPGPVTSAMSAGCHELLRSRPAAIAVTGPADVRDVLAQTAQTEAPEQERTAARELTPFLANSTDGARSSKHGRRRMMTTARLS
jgi:DNA processing protein